MESKLYIVADSIFPKLVDEHRVVESASAFGLFEVIGRIGLQEFEVYIGLKSTGGLLVADFDSFVSSIDSVKLAIVRFVGTQRLDTAELDAALP